MRVRARGRVRVRVRVRARVRFRVRVRARVRARQPHGGLGVRARAELDGRLARPGSVADTAQAGEPPEELLHLLWRRAVHQVRHLDRVPREVALTGLGIAGGAPRGTPREVGLHPQQQPLAAAGWLRGWLRGWLCGWLRGWLCS